MVRPQSTLPSKKYCQDWDHILGGSQSGVSVGNTERQTLVGGACALVGERVLIRKQGENKISGTWFWWGEMVLII